jgi:hypothetical protein
VKPPKLEPLTPAQRRNLVAAIEIQREFPKGFGYDRVARRVGITLRAAIESIDIIVRKGYMSRVEGGGQEGSLRVEWTPELTRFNAAREHKDWQRKQALELLGLEVGYTPDGIVTAEDAYQDAARIARQMGRDDVADAILARITSP